MSTDVFVHSFTHLKDMPREKEALAILQKVASLVKPIMRKRNWHLPELAEFYPSNPGLLGLNINGGEKICVRLRPYFDKAAFFQEHEIIGTMLHELTHNVHGPHDQNFYQYLSKLEDEYDALKRSGWAGEGFFSRGNKLGGGASRDLPQYLAREKAAAAAEQRMKVQVMLNNRKRLGGGQGQAGKSMRQLAAEAAERRMRDERSCASGAEAQREAERAARDGVKNSGPTDWDSFPEIFLIDDSSDESDEVTIIERPDSAAGTKQPRQDPGAGPSRRPQPPVSTRPEWACDA
ncbi:hypothetical protein FRB99_004182, partial [Tulasnella sp. 403]